MFANGDGVDESVLAHEAALHEDALRVPVNDFRGDVEKGERFDEPSVSDGGRALNDSTAATSDRLVESRSLVKVDSSEVQLTQISTLKSN